VLAFKSAYKLSVLRKRAAPSIYSLEIDVMKRKLWCALAALSLATPLLAYAADGYVVDNVNLRAGPDPSYPLVDQLPAGTEVGVQGCTDGWEWCDVINENDGNRGWIAGNYIQYEYEDQPVFLSDYGAQIGIPIVAFSVGTYWDRYYRGRPFYGDRARWYNQPYVRRAPPAPPRGYSGGSARGPDYGRGQNGNYGGQPGSRYSQPGHLGPVSPGYPVHQVPGGQVGRPGNGQFAPGQPNGRTQAQGHPGDVRKDEHSDSDHPDNNGH
jgi:uncharacterized protein YraI